MIKQFYFLCSVFVVYFCMCSIHAWISFGSPNIYLLKEYGPQWVMLIYSVISFFGCFLFYEHVINKKKK